MRTATALARAKASAAALPMEIEGELQVDAALDPQWLNQAGGRRRGRPANVLIFPDLASANIAFKLVQVLPAPNTFGQIISRAQPARRRDQSRGERSRRVRRRRRGRLPGDRPAPALRPP